VKIWVYKTLVSLILDRSTSHPFLSVLPKLEKHTKTTANSLIKMYFTQITSSLLLAVLLSSEVVSASPVAKGNDLVATPKKALAFPKSQAAKSEPLNAKLQRTPTVAVTPGTPATPGAPASSAGPAALGAGAKPGERKSSKVAEAQKAACSCSLAPPKGKGGRSPLTRPAPRNSLVCSSMY
jgi:hypothetical protein